MNEPSTPLDLALSEGLGHGAQHVEYSDAWLLARAHAAGETMALLRTVLPGCFDAHGRPIVASAHFPRMPR